MAFFVFLLLVFGFAFFGSGYHEVIFGRSVDPAHMFVICVYVDLSNGSERWNFHCHNYVREIRANSDLDQGLFRNSAFTNMHEFWACCVERFFEMSELFSSIHPHIYQLTKLKLGH